MDEIMDRNRFDNFRLLRKRVNDYAFHVFDSFLSSEIVPAFARRKLLRMMGITLLQTSTVWAGCSFRSNKISIGSNVFINVGFFFDGYFQCVIGDNVRIGQFVRIITATHEIGPSSQRGQTEVVGAPVAIEDGCWIATGVVLLPGVTVARGCVIAANAMVAESTSPNGLYAGTPARRIKELSA